MASAVHPVFTLCCFGGTQSTANRMKLISIFGVQVAAVVFYILCETVNKNQFVTNFVVCIVLLAMDFWTVSIIYG